MDRLPPFERALEAHEAEIYRFIRRLVPDADDAADLHQETFLRAYRSYGRLADGANVRAWLYRIAGNACRDHLRRRRVHARLLSRGDAARATSLGADGEDAARHAALEDPHGALNEDPHAAAVAGELREAFRAALGRLTWRQRLAVTARTFEGLGYAEIATALACSEASARQHVSQGRQRLRTLLAPYLDTEDPR